MTKKTIKFIDGALVVLAVIFFVLFIYQLFAINPRLGMAALFFIGSQFSRKIALKIEENYKNP